MVVHGIHAVLWALGKFVELDAVAEGIVSLKLNSEISFLSVNNVVEITRARTHKPGIVSGAR